MENCCKSLREDICAVFGKSLLTSNRCRVRVIDFTTVQDFSNSRAVVDEQVKDQNLAKNKESD